MMLMENIAIPLKWAIKNGLLMFESDPIGDEIHFGYDANQNLIQSSTWVLGSLSNMDMI